MSTVAPPGRQPRGAAVRSERTAPPQREPAIASGWRRETKRAAGEAPAPSEEGAADEWRHRRGPPGRAPSASSARSRPAPNVPCTRPLPRGVGSGDADAEVMFVGEAPGAEEDRQGLPFVGRAGQLLNELLEGIGMSREDVFIANVLKKPPPATVTRSRRRSRPAAFLFDQVRLIEPKVVSHPRNFATKLLSGNPAGITRVRGRRRSTRWAAAPYFLLPLFHPAAGLRTPAVKETLRGDFETLPKLLAGPTPAPPTPRRRSRRHRSRGRRSPRRPARLLSAEPLTSASARRAKRPAPGSPPTLPWRRRPRHR